MENLQDLLVHDEAVVRKMVHSTLQELLIRFPDQMTDGSSKSQEIRNRIAKMLSCTFRTGGNEAIIEALDGLVKLNPHLITTEALWATQEGKENHVKALLKLTNKIAYIAAINGLVEGCSHQSHRTQTIWSWLQKHHSKDPLEYGAIALNGLASIDADATREYLKNHWNDWLINIIQIALEQSPSPLLAILWQLVESADIRNDVLNLLTHIVRIAQPSLHENILQLFYKGLQHPDVEVWKPCLYLLIQLVELFQLVKDLVKEKDNVPSHIYLEIIKFATEEALKRPAAQAMIPLIVLAYLIELDYLNPDKLPAIYQKRQRDGITKALLELAEQNNELRRPIITTFSKALYIDVSQNLYEELVANQCNLEDWLFPFNMRSTATTTSPAHLEELVNEPDDYFAASQVTIWIYRQYDFRISHLVLAGHANSALCKRVSAKLLTTYLKYIDDKTTEAILVPGAFWIQTSNVIDQSSLNDLNQELGLLEASTGLVQVRDSLNELIQKFELLGDKTGPAQIRDLFLPNYTQIRNELHQQFKESLRTGTPTLLHRSNHNLSSYAIFAPFYILNGNNDDELKPLSFELNLRHFLGEQSDDILRRHRRELEHEIKEDAQRRKEVYEDWLKKETEGLELATEEMFYHVLYENRSLNPEDLNDLRTLRNDYFRDVLRVPKILNLHNDPPDRLPHWVIYLPQKSFRELREEDYQKVKEDIDTIRQVRNPSDRSDSPSPIEWQVWIKSIDQRLDWLRQFIYEHRLGRIFTDEEWNTNLDLIQKREIPVRGTKIPELAIIRDTDKTLGYITLQEKIEWSGLHSIRSDAEWIARMEELSRFGEADEEREQLDTINLEILLDAFLRGWLPVFLPDEDTKEEYEDWCAAKREVVWKEIRRLLMDRDIRMDPLQEDNVIFGVHKISENRVSITPYYLTTSQSFNVLIHPWFGITYYVNDWQHRQPMSIEIPDKRLCCEEVCRNGKEALVQGNKAEAVAQLKQALRIHPVVAAEQIFNDVWKNTTRDTHSQLEDMVSLVDARDISFAQPDFDQATQKLEHFIGHYPNFLPDPYLLLGYYQELQKDVIPLISERDRLVEAHNQRLETIRELAKREEPLIEQIQELQEIYNQKVEIYNGDLEPLQNDYNQRAEQYRELLELLLTNGTLTREHDFFGQETDQLIVNRRSPQLIELERLGTELVPYRQRIERREHELLPLKQELERYEQEIKRQKAELKRIQKKIKDGIAELKDRKQHIEQTEQDLIRAKQSVWDILRNQPNEHIRQARLLNETYVDAVLNMKILLVSDWYNDHIAPLLGLYKGNEYFNIVSKLDNDVEILLKQLKIRDREHQKVILDQLCLIMTACIESKYLTAHQLDSLQKLSHSLDEVRSELQANTEYEEVDSITREDSRYNIRSISESYTRRAYHLYNEAGSIPEITEVRQQVSVCLHRLVSYRRALDTLALNSLASDTLVDLPKIPLNNGFANAEFHVLDNVPMEIEAVRVDEESQTIQVRAEGEWRSVLGFQGLSDAECQHLANEFADEEFLEKVRGSKLTPAYGILYTPIRVPPQTRLWIEVLKSLETWLIKALAFTGVPPVETDTLPTEEILSVYDDAPVITRVEVNGVDRIERFLESIGQKRKVTVQEI